MRRVYGLDLDHTLTYQDMRPRILAALATNLPDGSQCWKTLNTTNAWTIDQYLLAMQADQMSTWLWGNSDPKRRGPQPKPIPRPGHDHASRNTSTGGVHQASVDNAHTSRHIDTQSMTVDQLDQFMNRPFITRKR